MKRILSALFCAIFVSVLCTLLCVGALADGGILHETVNLINANKNMRGDGYSWNNPTDTLTLTNFSVDTTDSYGLRVPDGATVILEGDSTVKASFCAFGVEGNVTIKGNGTLTLLSDEYGILCASNDMNKKLSFYSGTVKIVSRSDGIHSETAWVSQNNDAALSVYVSGEDAYAIRARQVKLLGGTFEADAPVLAADLKVSSLSLKILCDRPALVGTKTLSVSGVSIEAGASENEMEKISEYTDECCVRMKKHWVYKETSLFYGGNVKGYWDFVTIVVAIAVVAAVLLTPYIKHKKSLEKIEAAKAAARVEEKENRRRAAEAELREKQEREKREQALADATDAENAQNANDDPSDGE